MDLYDLKRQLNSGKTIYDLPLRVTYYARVSTGKDEQLHSLSAQIQYYSDMIQRVPNWTYVEGYIDEGISATSVAKRENFLRMIEDAKAGLFDFILTKEISRFSRNTLDSIQYTKELLLCGVGVFFESDNINTLMPDSELRLTIMSSIAQDEVRKISERVKFGFQRAIEKGVVLGNNRIWGYRKQEGKLVIVEEEAEVVRLIFDLYANQLKGVRTIASYLTDHGYRNTLGNNFSYSTISGILRNPKYKGYYCGGKSHKYDYKINDRKYLSQEEWVMYKDEETVPPIVSEELWDKANDLLLRRSLAQSSPDKAGYQNRYPYSGKIICSQHQIPYYRQLYRYKSGDKEVWQCQEYSKKGKAGCASPIIYTTELDDIVRRSLEHLALNKEDVIRELTQIYASANNESKIRENIAKCQLSIEEVSRRKDKLLDLSIDGRITNEEFSLRNERFNEELEKLNARLAELQQEAAQDRDLTNSINTLRQLITEELNFDDGFHPGVIDSLLDKVVVFPADKPNEIKVAVYIKVTQEVLNFKIQRRRGKLSLCSEQCT